MGAVILLMCPPPFPGTIYYTPVTRGQSTTRICGSVALHTRNAQKKNSTHTITTTKNCCVPLHTYSTVLSPAIELLGFALKEAVAMAGTRGSSHGRGQRWRTNAATDKKLKKKSRAWREWKLSMPPAQVSWSNTHDGRRARRESRPGEA